MRRVIDQLGAHRRAVISEGDGAEVGKRQRSRSQAPPTTNGYDGPSGTAKAVKSTGRKASLVDPLSVNQIFANGLAKVAINAVDPAIRLRALRRLAEVADQSPKEVREALRFKFAAPKHSLAEYEAELSHSLGVDSAHAFMCDTRKLAGDLKKAGTSRIVLVSATFAGGGVAEMFQTQAHILQQLGIEVEWQKTWTADADYGEVCRKAFDAFQGGSTVISDDDHKLWADHNALLARIYQGIAGDPEVGAIFLEDHHAIHFIPAIKATDPDKRVVWRSHVDMAGVLAGKAGAVSCWEKAILPNIELLGENDVILFQPGSVPPATHQLRAAVFAAPPGIDTLSKKNEPVTWDQAKEILARIAPDLNVDKPHLVAGGRFVPWKGIIPTVRAYLSVAADFPDIDLLVFGSAGKDDWRKVEYLQQYEQMMAEADPAVAKRVKLVLNKSEELAAGYKLAARHNLPFCAYSIAEGFNLMCDEAARQGAVPATTLQGGLVRFKDSEQLAPFSASIASPAARLTDPKLMYTIIDGKLAPSPEAKEIEDILATSMRRTFAAHRDDEAYVDRYSEAAKAAQIMTLNTSLLVMSRNYLAAAAATPFQLEVAAASNIGSTGAAGISSIADLVHSPVPVNG